MAKALKKDPRQRYASVTTLADDLLRYLKHEPIGTSPACARKRSASFSPRG